MSKKAAEIDLARLNQQQAALLIGKPPSWLRDATAPRNGDGSYSGPAVVAWMLAQQPTPRHEPSAEAERVRKLRADVLEIELEERRMGFGSVETIMDAWRSTDDCLCDECRQACAAALGAWRRERERKRGQR